MEQHYDVVIIGGGINGCGCAAEASLRGLSVLLCEQDDLASKTSSSSSKLIHGGLRYLELGDFSLVRKALQERQLLLDLAPHLVHPLAMVLPTSSHSRPAWLLRLGLFLYDNLSKKNKLPPTQSISRATHLIYFKHLQQSINKGYLFYDGVTDDARLTLANALQAKAHGATLLTYTRFLSATPNKKGWLIQLQAKDNTIIHLTAKALINAAGPWLTQVSSSLNTTLKHQLTLVKGSHVVVPKLYEGTHAYMLQHQDKRVVFVMPYHDHTMIGTTDVILNQPLNELHIDTNEIDYLLALVNRYFQSSLSTDTIIQSWSGVRPLLSKKGNDKPRVISRDYSIDRDTKPALHLTIYGGKITTYRQLAVEAINQLTPFFHHISASISHKTPLPGAQWNNLSFEEFKLFVSTSYHWLDKATLARYLQTYGTRLTLILKDKHRMQALGRCFAPTVYQAEIDYLIAHEWAKTLDDILWRRTKLGLSLTETEKKSLQRYLEARLPKSFKCNHLSE